MMIHIGFVAIAGLVLFVAGFIFAFYLISKDQSIVRIKPDEQIVKKPSDGLVLVAMTPDALRGSVVQRESPDSATDVQARDIYRRFQVTQNKT